MQRHVIRFAPALVWTALLIVVCLWPRSYMPTRENHARHIPHVDKAVHFGLFAVFGALWIHAMGHSDRRVPRAVVILAAGLLLAVGTELAQGLPAVARDPDVLDGAADCAGVGFAVGAIRSRRVRGR